MNWEPEAKAKFDKMMSLIPFFQRKMAERMGSKKAEENASERDSDIVEEHDIVRALESETPTPFKPLMRDTAAKVGFNMDLTG